MVNERSTSSLPANDMKTMALARIEEEIIWHKLALSDLYIRRNTFSPIFCLPTEILATIFILCARDCYLVISLHNWWNVSHVCHHWREVALNCPTLWTHISKLPHRWTEEFLDRSKTAPLKIRITVPYTTQVSRWVTTVEKVMQHAERIQELSLDLPGIHGEEILSKLSSPAPRLRTLRIALGSSLSEQPLVLFDGDTPALRTLEFSDCPVLPSSLKLNGLTTLKLFYFHLRPQQNVQELLATLSCMQDLAQLHLDGALNHPVGFLSSATFNTFQKVNLPRLSRISIAAPLSAVIAFLSCINNSSNAEFRLECHCEDDPSMDNYSLLSSILGQRFSVAEHQEPANQAIRSLAIDSDMEDRTEILVFSSSERHFRISRSRMEWGCNTPLQILLVELRVDRDRVISDICRSIPLTHLQSVHVCDPPISSNFWMRTFGHLQNLRYIKLSQGSMPELASLLDDHCTDASDQIFAPGLEELELENITFTTDWDAFSLQSLEDAVSTREQVQLIVNGCGVNDYADDGPGYCLYCEGSHY